ncbi:MAG: hypothetical protein AAF125_27915, partial [Chloroflexota bacterium]
MTQSHPTEIPLFDTLRRESRAGLIYQQAATAALVYLLDVDDRPVAPTPEAVARLAELDEPLPDAPHD